MHLSFHRLGSWLFWTPMFALRLFMGGEAVDYGEFAQISLRGLGYLCNSLLIALALLKWQQGRGRPSLPAAAITLAFVLVVHYLIAGLVTPKILSTSYLPFLRGVLWIVSCVAYARLLFRSESFIGTYLWWASATGAIALASLAIYRTTGMPVNVLISDGAPRIQGLLSEPSALAYACAPAAGIFFHRKQFIHVALLVAAIAFSYSVIAVASVLVVLGLAFLVKWIRLGAAKIYLVSCLASVLLVPLLLFFSSHIATVSTNLLERMPRHDEGGFFLQRVIHRPLDTLILLDQRLENPSDESAGSAERLLALDRLLEEMRADGVLWNGYGLNTFGNFWASTHENSILDYGAVPFFISSFGLAAAALLLLLVFIRTYRLLSVDRELLLLVFGAIIATSYNSAGGLLVYSPFVLMVMNVGRVPAISDKSRDRGGRSRRSEGFQAHNRPAPLTRAGEKLNSLRRDDPSTG